MAKTLSQEQLIREDWLLRMERCDENRQAFGLLRNTENDHVCALGLLDEVLRDHDIVAGLGGAREFAIAEKAGLSKQAAKVIMKMNDLSQFSFKVIAMMVRSWFPHG